MVRALAHRVARALVGLVEDIAADIAPVASVVPDRVVELEVDSRLADIAHSQQGRQELAVDPVGIGYLVA